MRDFITELGREAGKLAMTYRRDLSSLAIDFKSERDLVTEADKAVEEMLISRIQARYPDHGIFGEETGEHVGTEYRWIIDPIDGTASFVHNQPFFSTSIALEHRGEIVLGCVYAPVLDEIFIAERGQGAWCNGSPIRVSSRTDLSASMMATGFACIRSGLANNNLPYFIELVQSLRDVRRYGSAAIDLSFVAAGRIEGFWELNLQLYDIAAGWLLVEEAGGRLTDFSGGTSDLPGRVLASNGHFHDELIDIFARITDEQA